VKKQVKHHQKTIDQIERLKVYIRDNPTCSLKDAAIVLGVKHTLVRKWKSLGFFEHMTPAAARKAGITTQAEAKAAIERRETAEVYRKPRPKPQPRPQPRPAYRPQPVLEPDDNGDNTTEQPAGEVAPLSMAGMDEIDQLIAKGKDLKISQIRSLVKSHLMLNVHDPKAVANYAAGLKALSGVQDVELEDVYENEQLMKIYVPQEDAIKALEIIEVEKIEY
jgi:hypothetical protein